MEYNKIIYILVVVFIILLVAGFAIFNTSLFKQDSFINVKNNDTLYDGDYFSIKLKDANGNPLANQIVNIIIIDANGGENRQQVTTDGSGNGMLQLNGLTPGEYTFNVTYGGNNNYKESTITKKITIAAQVTSSSNSGSDTQSSGWYDSDGVYHFYENGKEYVGSRNGQHMDIETANYVREHGMT